MTHYNLIERAILYLTENAVAQPSLEDVAAHVGLSPYHFQRVFREWAGVSPKKFVQFVTLAQAKDLLRKEQSVLAATDDVGLSSPSRLHDLFVTIEGMTPAEYKNSGQGLAIDYSFASTPFGEIITASTAKGICYLAFYTTESEGLEGLQRIFPRAVFARREVPFHHDVKLYFENLKERPMLKLNLKGTPFQLKIWQALLTIPRGSVSTYSALAQAVQLPRASRAVGNAVGANPIAYIIPCHRVLCATGAIGGYHWGVSRKQAMLIRENAAQLK